MTRQASMWSWWIRDPCSKVSRLHAQRHHDKIPDVRISFVHSQRTPGKALLRTLTEHDIPCSYTLLASAASIIPRASLVLLGTAALFSDGSLYSRAGTAAVAMLAKENRIPVVAACETYKFGERVLLDAVTGNELGECTF